MHMPRNNGWSIGAIDSLLNGTKTATESGLLSPTQTTAGSIDPMNANGTVNQPLVSALQGLQQLQDGNFGTTTPYVAQQLNQLGYQTLQQGMAGKQWHQAGAPATVAANSLRKRY